MADYRSMPEPGSFALLASLPTGTPFLLFDPQVHEESGEFRTNGEFVFLSIYPGFEDDEGNQANCIIYIPEPSDDVRAAYNEDMRDPVWSGPIIAATVVDPFVAVVPLTPCPIDLRIAFEDYLRVLELSPGLVIVR
jgi:hypothetical protein